MWIERSLSAIRKSDFASGGNTLGEALSLRWWQVEQVPWKVALPRATRASSGLVLRRRPRGRRFASLRLRGVVGEVDLVHLLAGVDELVARGPPP